MELDRLRIACSIEGKNGISFLLAAVLLWCAYAIIYFQSFDLRLKNVMMLILTGLLFPLAVGISRLIQADWKLKGHPLSRLGLILNTAQFIYFPLVFWTFVDFPEKMLVVFAVITGAHFFPYGWFYQATSYYVMAPVISVSVMVIGSLIEPSQLWIISVLMPLLLMVLILWLWMDYKKKKESF